MCLENKDIIKMHYEDAFSYIRDLFAKESNELQKIRESTVGKNNGIYIYPEEGKLLQLLIKMNNIKTIIEIGTLSGYSATWMAEALPENGKLYTFEHDEKRYQMAKENVTNPKIEIIKGAALNTLPSIEDKGPFDMIFIDANKNDYHNYLSWAEKNIRKGGIITADNTLLFDAVWDENTTEKVSNAAKNSMREFNLRLSDTEKYTSIMLPTEQGFNIAIKNF